MWGRGDDRFVLRGIFQAPLASLCPIQTDGSTVTLHLLINMTYPLFICREWGRGQRDECMSEWLTVDLSLLVRNDLASSALPCPPSSSLHFCLTHSQLVCRSLLLTSFLSAPSPLFPFCFSLISVSLSLSLPCPSSLLSPAFPLTLSDCPQPPAHLLTGRIITLVHHCPEKSNNLNLHLPHTPGLNYFIDM